MIARLRAPGLAILAATAACTSLAPARRDGRVPSADGVAIAYTVAGAGDTALVFIHGGFADRAFWKEQLASLGDRFRLVALDLAGHGESGRDRKEWTIAAFAQDVRAVVEALDLRRAVILGNSLGGPVALEAARLLPGRVLGVIAVDTLHDATEKVTAAEAQARAEAFRRDFEGTCRELIDALFHPGAHLDLRAWAEARMLAMPPQIAAAIMAGMAGYDIGAAVRGAGVPIRAINGDLWPTDIAKNRTIAPGFDAVIMKGTGHYPMLERPAEFDRILVDMVHELSAGR